MNAVILETRRSVDTQEIRYEYGMDIDDAIKEVLRMFV